MTRRLLVTTALEQTWGDGKPILYAGEWCRLYDRRGSWGSRPHEVLPYHWSDRAKLARDHRYLNDLQEALLPFLAEALNGLHGLEHPVRYWRMVLGVWLPTYVAVLFDRWECLRLAFLREESMDTVALPPAPHDNDPPRDGDAFINLAAYSPEWNHQLFLRIIRHAHASRCAVRQAERTAAGRQPGVDSPRAPVPRRSVAKSALRALVWRLDALAGRLCRSYRVTFFSSYFSATALVRLNLALRQLPRLYLGEFAYPAPLSGDMPRALRPERAVLRIPRRAGSDFEAFLSERILRDLPRAYLEDYPVLLQRVRQIRISTRVICSAVAHWSNELFKLWCAEEILKGTKFVALTHGGAIPVSIDQTMYFEEKVSDRKVTWSIPFLPNHVRLPPNKLIGKRISSSKTICSVITQETPLHPFRASEGPIGIGVLEVVPLVGALFAGLRAEIQRCVRVKPYRDLGWNTRQRISDVIGADRIYAGQSYADCMAQSRVIICTYPETTFAEAMASGLPTMLVYSAHLWQTIPQLEGLLATLRSAGIVYADPQRAAEHVNRIWDDADGWWSTPAVLAARAEFCGYCLDLDKGWVRKWTGFLRECAA